MVKHIKSRILEPIKDHERKWKDCTRCPLHQTRSRVVLWRGWMPCDFLLIGEAPGESEDCLGEPFVGPAGNLLDQILADAISAAGGAPWRYAVTNLVACFPREAKIEEASSGSIRPPRKEEIQACRPRLLEFVAIAKPRLIVALGAIARQFAPWPESSDTTIQCLIHPAAILRMDNQAQRDLAYKRCVLTLTEALRQLKGDQ